MTINKIDVLEKYRAVITLGEIGALLHDLGKLDGKFLKKHRKDVKEQLKYEHEEIINYDEKVLSDLGLLDFFSIPLSNLVSPFIPTNDEILKSWNLNSVAIKDMIEKHHEDKIKDEKLLGFIKLADRKDSADDRLMPIAQQERKTCLASVFGMEIDINEDELEKLRKDFYNKLSGLWKRIGSKLSSDNSLFSFRDSIIKEWESLSNITLAETRRSANDVTLWDHSYAVASITKALMVEDILNNFSTFLPNRASEHWRKKLRILGVAWDASKIYKEAQTLSGIVGRSLLMEEIRKRIKNLLEFEIPVGNVIYEDHNFICFLVPENLDSIFKEIKNRLISEVIELSNGSIIPCIELSDPNPYPSKIIVQTLNKLQNKIKAPLLLEGSLDKVSWIKEWKDVKNREVCVECGKRPRMLDRDVCEWCQSLRVIGAKAFKKQNEVFEEKETVWIDEIADENGNVALIYGFIPLENWLNGTLLKTMLIKTIDDVIDLSREVRGSKIWEQPEYKEIRENIERRRFSEIKEMLNKFLNQINKEGYKKVEQKLIRPFLSDELPLEINISNIYSSLKSRIGSDKAEDWVTSLFTKPPSPSRLSRIWRETWNFVNELVSEAQNIVKESIGGYSLRIKIEPEFIDEEAKRFFENKNNKYQPYELVKLENFDIPLPKMDLYWDGEYFTTTLRIENYVTANQLKSQKQILEEKQRKIKAASEKIAEFKIKIKGGGEEKVVQIKIKSINFEKYLSFRKIMTSPNRFEILVPANLALKIAQKFLNKYNDKFSKVRGRLSFSLGIIFFKRKFPLFAVMDGVERSIESLSTELNEMRKKFKVTNVDDSGIEVVELDNIKEKISTEFGSWINIYKWKVHRMLGDGSEDLYHPNFIVTDASGSEETYFQIKKESKEGKDIESISAIVNVKDLKERTIEVTPNLFDFQFFDSTVRRFDLVLPRKHELLEGMSPRPYLLEDIEKMFKLWDILNKKLTKTQIKKLESVCASKIEEWKLKGRSLTEDSEFKEFVVSSVKNLCEELKEDEQIVISSILSGMFFDVVELFTTLKSEIGSE